MCLNLVINILKYGIGRLRPHFISYCAPIDPTTGMSLSNCSALPDPYAYIDNYVCDKGEHWNLRLSFFSGHAAHMSYMTVFTSVKHQFLSFYFSS